MIKNIIWDFDGTLCNSYPQIAGTFKDILEENNIDIAYKKILKGMKKNSAGSYITNICTKYNLNRDEIYLEQSRKVDKNIEKNSKLYKNTVQSIKKLKERGINSYILSHQKKDIIFKILKKYNIEKEFLDVVTPEEGFKRKPSDEMFVELINRNNIDPKKTLNIGDRILDHMPAKKLKMKTCYYDEDNLNEKFETDFKIKKMTEVLKI